VSETYNTNFGHRPKSAWGDGDILSPYAEGDIVFIPATSPAFTGGRIPHSFSRDKEANPIPGVYRVIAAFSIGEDSSWYFRVCPLIPIAKGEKWATLWTEVSDRLHIIKGQVDYTEGWVLLFSAEAAVKREL
jgi:hypothetical protein